jgi:hypothetical protein
MTHSHKLALCLYAVCQVFKDVQYVDYITPSGKNID